MTHICVRKLTIIGSNIGLSPGRRQAIIWTNAGILLIWPLETNFSEILIEIHIFSFMKMHLKLSGICRQFCLSLNVLIITNNQTLVTCPLIIIENVVSVNKQNFGNNRFLNKYPVFYVRTLCCHLHKILAWLPVLVAAILWYMYYPRWVKVP